MTQENKKKNRDELVMMEDKKRKQGIDNKKIKSGEMMTTDKKLNIY